MSKKLPLVFFALMGMVLFSCKKTYVCRCVTFNGTKTTSIRTYDLLENNRKEAGYTCKGRSFTSKYNTLGAECRLAD